MTDTNGGQTGAAPALNCLVQYCKDLSFENPNAPRSLGPQEAGPNISIQVNVNAKQLADKRGYTQTIEASGAKFACDTCMAVAPLKGRFKSLATTSAKGCFYSRQNNMKTKMGSIEECVQAAVTGKWNS